MTRVLTQRELNRSVLARQLLLKRSGLSVPKALEQLAGIQAQYAPSSYIRLWDCLRRFARGDLDRLLGQRKVVQGTLMRSTIHLVSRRDYWRFAEGIGPSRQEWWRQIWGKEFSPAEMERIAAKLDAELTGRTWPRKELDQLMRSHSTTVWSGAWVSLIRVPPSGTWSRRRADLFQRAAEWIGPSDADERTGLHHLLRRFLGGFGPARLADAAGWAGVATESMKSVAEGMTLRRFRDERDRELVDLPRAPLPSASTRTGPIPPDLGCDAPQPFPPDPDPARGVSAGDLQHQDAAFDRHLPGGWIRGRQLAGRTIRRARHPRVHAIRTATGCSGTGAARGSRGVDPLH